MGGYIFILILLVGMWFLLIRPQRRRQMEAQRLLQSLEVGKEIVTAGGIHGTLREIEGDLVQVEIAPGTIIRLDRRAVASVLSDPEPEEPSASGES